VNVEHIEAELASLNGKMVAVVRPGYGTQSDSWNGQLQTIKSLNPLHFHFISVGQTMLFTADDVSKLDPSIDERMEKIIRLKGPHDYAETYRVTA
jgi:hypothetical protein